VPPFPARLESGERGSADDLPLPRPPTGGDGAKSQAAPPVGPNRRATILDEAGFLEIETPILSNPDPEGARDFLVPSRLNPGSFTRCRRRPQAVQAAPAGSWAGEVFSDRPLLPRRRSARRSQPEFTQIDVEASFITDTEIQTLIEGLLARIFREAKGVEIPTPFPRMTYREAMDRYGSDKPDTRFGLEITDLWRDVQGFAVQRSSGP
jgi:aspartyl-tRNA synthetase